MKLAPFTSLNAALRKHTHPPHPPSLALQLGTWRAEHVPNRMALALALAGTPLTPDPMQRPMPTLRPMPPRPRPKEASSVVVDLTTREKLSRGV